MLNTLKYVKTLEEVGLPRAQAETHVQIMAEIMETNFATKQDLKDLAADMKHEFSSFRAEMNQDSSSFRAEVKHEFSSVRAELKQEMSSLRSEIAQSEYRQTIKLGTIVSIALGIAVALSKLI